MLQDENLTNWLLLYGGWAIFFLLAIGIVALPVPEETLLVITGMILSGGSLPMASTIFAAYAGSMTGITVSYWLGRTVGVYFIHKYGSWVGLTEARLQNAHNWFERYGKWTLFVGYFIPGVRHFTGLSAGTTYLEYKHFALYAYSGAFFWVSLFLSIGYYFGNYCLSFVQNIDLDGETTTLIAITLCAAIFLAYLYKKR